MKYLFYTILTLILSTTVCSAATLSVSMEQTLTVRNQSTVDILLDPEGENINSVELSILYPSDYLAFKGYVAVAGNIPVWIEEPRVASAGVIHLSGIIPGGLERRYDPEHPTDYTLPLVRLLFVPTSTGEGTVAIEKALLLRNDGKGTAVAVTKTEKHFSIVANQNQEPVLDSEVSSSGPQPFSIMMVRKSPFGRTPRLAVFEAVDLETGIDHYEVRINRGKYHTATSPYPLPSRIFGYTLSVRAYDFDGNSREQQVPIPGASVTVKVVIAVVLVTGIVLYIRWRRKIDRDEGNT